MFERLRDLLPHEIQAASGQEQADLKDQANELLQKEDFSGRDFNEFTDLMIKLLGGRNYADMVHSNFLNGNGQGLIHLRRFRSRIDRINWSFIGIEHPSIWQNNGAKILKVKEVSIDRTGTFMREKIQFGERGAWMKNGTTVPVLEVDIDHCARQGVFGIEFPPLGYFIQSQIPLIERNGQHIIFDLSNKETQEACAKVFSIYANLQEEQIQNF